ncbi:MAG TPA: hypothetical protein PLL72_06725 [Burkholderiaceae bacterium]|nr:hypothetical protein [Burkholderiaceae bacterium]
MRTITSAAATALQSRTPPLAVLVEMDLTPQVFLNTSSWALTWNGSTYLGTGGLGSIGQMEDTPSEVKGLEFTLAGAATTMVSLALGNDVQGKAVRVKLAIFDPATYQILDVSQAWAGTLDVMSVEDDPAQKVGSLSVSSEHAGINLFRPYTSLWSDLEQQRLYPGDPSLQFMADQVDMKIQWPLAEWFKQQR